MGTIIFNRNHSKVRKKDMRTISLDDATYAALWSRWQEGDDGEVGIIKRLLGLPSKKASAASSVPGFVDKRSGVQFPQGFEIFRTFKGTVFRAVAEGGVWRLPDGRTAPSLNSLSAMIGAPTENAWMGWRYYDNRKVQLIDVLRDSKGNARRISTTP